MAMKSLNTVEAFIICCVLLQCILTGHSFVLVPKFSSKIHFQTEVWMASTDPVLSASPCRIKVIGVGGGGGNAVNRIMESSLSVSGAEFWAVNTDVQALSKSIVPSKLNIGAKTSRYSLCMQLNSLGLIYKTS